MDQRINVLVLHSKDSVGVAIHPLREGDCAVYTLDTQEIELRIVQDIPLYHKVAIVNMAEGQAAYKYGQVIGRTTSNIKAGQHVHSHNMVSDRESFEEIRRGEKR
ncbi:MAG TPA: UxaA family hydrolase [Desulfosporosinus sp.]|nr:UxaA family hydrolase [Desulfosporosinus sp.]